MEDSKIPSEIKSLVALTQQASPNLAAIKKQTRLLVDLFNEQELFLLEGLTSKEYTCHLLAHLLDDVDIVNARYLLKRTPDLVNKRSKTFQQIVSAIEPLENYAYELAL